jgi:hypothetical protein
MPFKCCGSCAGSLAGLKRYVERLEQRHRDLAALLPASAKCGQTS